MENAYESDDAGQVPKGTLKLIDKGCSQFGATQIIPTCIPWKRMGKWAYSSTHS